MATAPTPKFQVPEPHTFEGDPLKFRSWMKSVHLYLQWFPTLNDSQKIRLALGFMNGGSATQWRDTYIETYFGTTPVPRSWTEFGADIIAAFDDKGAVERARTALDRLRSN